MRLRQAMELELLAQGAALAPTSRHHAVMSPHMKKSGGGIRPHVGKESVGHSGGHQSGVRKGGFHPKTLSVKHPHVHLVHPHFPKMRADASTVEPTDNVRMLHWKTKRVLERIRKRNRDPYEALKAEREVTGPCGCTLRLGERVTVDDVGRGLLLSRKERMLTVALDNGNKRTIDQKFVHRML
jgi:hypothetical protein